jgi:hypothetical protein
MSYASAASTRRAKRAWANGRGGGGKVSRVGRAIGGFRGSGVALHVISS